VTAARPLASEASVLPSFVIIGAAKAGTTALYWYLAEHPQVFMSPVKETNFFAYGLDDEGNTLYGDPDLHRFPVRTSAAYGELFSGAGEALAIGEASPIYLECPQSAARIRETLPEARIICGLREPVDRAYSDYLMYLRARGRRLDPARDLTASSDWARPDSHWMQISKYHEALSRYFDRFPREQIDIFLFDDFRSDVLGCVRDLYRAIGVYPGFVPDLDTPHNIGGMPANRTLEKVFTSGSVKKALEPWIPRRAADMARRLRTRNLRKAPPLPEGLKAELGLHFRDDIAMTSELIGRNLDHWLSTP
jgi:Sulfotransferase family